jgi:hypothetical protein
MVAAELSPRRQYASGASASMAFTYALSAPSLPA